jgi:ferredoxin
MRKRLYSFFIKPSTRAFYHEGKKLSAYSFFDWIHGYVYARWPYLYIGVATGEHKLTGFFKRLWGMISRLLQPESKSRQDSQLITAADTYHGKVVPLEEAKQLVTIKKEVSIKNIEQVIPYNMARDIILKNPDHIVALECPCRASRKEPCLPLDVCLIIGEPFASFISEHHPRRSRWISQEEAVEIVSAEHQRGHVQHAFFKDAMLGRFYAICNCCSCCCGAMQAWRNGTPMLASSGYLTRIDSEICTGCGTCVESCQFKALSLVEETTIVDEDKCLGCGVCVSKCSQGALQLMADPSKGIPLEIRELMAEQATVGVKS